LLLKTTVTVLVGVGGFGANDGLKSPGATGPLDIILPPCDKISVAETVMETMFGRGVPGLLELVTGAVAVTDTFGSVIGSVGSLEVKVIAPTTGFGGVQPSNRPAVRI
jgi:hypothetical protein